MQALLVHLVQSLLEIIPPSADLRRAFENGSDEDCLFVKRLALLLGESFYLFVFCCLFCSDDFCNNAQGKIFALDSTNVQLITSFSFYSSRHIFKVIFAVV